MPLRLFGGQGSSKVRACPACEREIAAEASFCPSCYMVIRPDGAAALREYLRGGRIPADVYLLRKMQVEDPNTGPVVRESPPTLGGPSAAEPVVRQETPKPSRPEPPAPPAAGLAAAAPTPASPSTPAAVTPPVVPAAPPESSTIAPTESHRGEMDSGPRTRAWKGVQSLLRFDPPFPPPTQSAEGASALLTWMLDRDPVIPNNLELLDTIHAGIFQDGPATHLGYREHLLIQIADDLLLHPNQEALDAHLGLLAAAYRRAAGAYHTAAHKGEAERNTALWQMASMASRLRLEAWVFRTRHGMTPNTTRPRRSRTSRFSAD
jgi:hypothetical protein